MLDPLLSLSLSLNSNKGVFALLLGSGISSTAGIPTGWAIVTDLIRQIAALQGEDCSVDPEAWYVKKYGIEPNYSVLLNDVAKSPTERSRLLKSYFEPTEEERKQGLKTPTKAHMAIAAMVSSGHIKVILTTNFDSLLEEALHEVGVTPTLISTVDSISGALPIVHSSCTIIKLHGDYMDTRIKNTLEELQTYDDQVNNLLDRVLDEYGLIICGWSGDWDFALINALERCKSRRFTTYWTLRGEPSANAKKLIDLRKAEIIKIKNADDFFDSVNEKIRSLEELTSPHPLSTKVAVASLKRFIADPKYQIRLHDLVMQETEQLCEQLSEKHFSVDSQYSDQDFLKRVTAYEFLAETLKWLFATGCYWSDESQTFIWIKALTLIGSAWQEFGGINKWLKLNLYPALLAMYAGGIAFVARGRYGQLQDLLVESTVTKTGVIVSAVQQIHPQYVFSGNSGAILLGMSSRHYTPESDYLYKVLRNSFKALLPNEHDYERAFDTFEYLLTLVYLDLKVPSDMPLEKSVSMPYGRFVWKYYVDNNEIGKIQAEAAKLGAEWPPIKQGMFDGSVKRFEQLTSICNQFIAAFYKH